MFEVEWIDTADKGQVQRFLELPYQIYENTPQWVPTPRVDVRTMLDRDKHPFYEHSTADFLLVKRDGHPMGRLAVMENRQFNKYHGTKTAQFYLFECENDIEAARTLFTYAFEWARKRGLDNIVGPKGFGPLDGYGILVEGFENRRVMSMSKYNHAYYPELLTALEFRKEVDFVSRRLDAVAFQLPERVHRITERVKQRRSFGVRNFSGKRELRKWAERLGDAYNGAFVDNWEYYPLTQNEIDYVVDNIITVADPRLIKVITRDEEIVGFLFGFPDVSSALKRAGGRLMPWHIADMVLEMRRTKVLALNGAGILPAFHGIGGNALLYVEMYNTINDYEFEEAILVQVAETAEQMRSDLNNVGAKPYQNHRVYRREL